MTTIILNSNDRNQGTNVNGSIKLSNTDKLNGTYTVTDFIMPNFMYNINDKNNNMVLGLFKR